MHGSDGCEGEIKPGLEGFETERKEFEFNEPVVRSTVYGAESDAHVTAMFAQQAWPNALATGSDSLAVTGSRMLRKAKVKRTLDQAEACAPTASTSRPTGS